MQDFIIFAVIAALVLIGIGSAVKHFRGQGGCCGGSSYKPRRKVLKRAVDRRIFHVEGMHCRNCSNRVTEAVNDVPHAVGFVNLKKGIVTVYYEEPVPDEQIIAGIQRVGYSVTKVEP